MLAVTAAALYGSVRVAASTLRNSVYVPATALIDLDAGTCVVSTLPPVDSPLPLYSYILDSKRERLYGINLTHVFTIDAASARVLSVVPFPNPGAPPASTPTYYLGYELGGVLYGWLQHTRSSPYYYSLASVDPRTGAVAQLASQGCSLGPSAVDAAGGVMYMSHYDCNYAGESVYAYNATTGARLNVSGDAYFSVFALALGSPPSPPPPPR